MRATISLLPTLAAAALAAAASPAAAQHAVAATSLPAVHRATPVHPVASFRLIAARDAGIVGNVTIADSAGTLVASYRLPGERAARPLTVTVVGSDLVLRGEMAEGLLTLHLVGVNEGDPAVPVQGRWSLGGQRGTLRGLAAR